jgi:hypothetical protein
MPIQSSFATVASQITAFNKNIVETLSKINSLSTTKDPSVDVQIIDTEGVLRTYSLPSFTFLKTEIERLNNSINSLYSIDAAGALIQTSQRNKFKKIITVDLNREPNPISDLGQVVSFYTQKNWFFDSMLNPMLFIELDLSGKIEDNVRKILSRRYIVDFNKDENGNFTSLGQSAIQAFNTLFRGSNDIDIQDFVNWHRTTPGVVNPLDPNYDEQVFDLEPNVLLYDGVFNVLNIEQDTLNRKLWYHVNTLTYLVNETLETKQLAVGDELIVNVPQSSTRYKIIEISNTESNFRLRFERIEGLQPIPVGIGMLKIYSPVVYRKKVRVSVGYNEREVLFIKAMNADNNLIAKDWSKGTGFYTSDLRLNSRDNTNGYSMDQFYTDFVYDYGEVLQDLVAKKTPNTLAGIPNTVILNSDNFKVVQINRHLTENGDANLLKNKHNYTVSLKSELKQIQEAIDDRNKKLRVTRFSSKAAQQQFEQELNDLMLKKDSKSKILATTTQEIIDLSKSPTTNVEPKYRLRGFWSIPEPVVTKGTLPQEVIQFRIQYRYTSKEGREPSVDTFTITENNAQTTAAFSNWTEYKTDVRKRTFDQAANQYFWEIEDVESADTPNINQIDIPISFGEQVEMRMKSISEVGWPESPVESDWSDILTIQFPDELSNILNDNDFILQEASKEDLRVNMQSELNARGLDQHLSDTAVINNKIYHHAAEKIISGFRDENGVTLDLFQYLQALEERVKILEERVKRVKGELQIIIIRNNQEFEVKNNSETSFNVELEEYCEAYTPGRNFGVSKVPEGGRQYENSIYVIKDFVVRVKNKAVDSPLGLLSNRDYSASAIYNSIAPQVFWVNNEDELLFSDIAGVSKTQLNNQFIWCLNYDSITQTSLVKLSENIGNQFVNLTDNSLTNTLSLAEYNLGYSENSALAFLSGNNSLLDTTKWNDSAESVGSTDKLLTTIHPVINDLQSLTETNDDKIKTLAGNGEIIIPINIYFKMNALNNTKTGKNYEYVDFNRTKNTVVHTKKLKFFIEDENQNRPFVFTLKFKLNRNKVTYSAKPKVYNTVVK